MNLKILSTNWWPFCHSINMLSQHLRFWPVRTSLISFCGLGPASVSATRVKLHIWPGLTSITFPFTSSRLWTKCLISENGVVRARIQEVFKRVFTTVKSREHLDISNHWQINLWFDSLFKLKKTHQSSALLACWQGNSPMVLKSSICQHIGIDPIFSVIYPKAGTHITSLAYQMNLEGESCIQCSHPPKGGTTVPVCNLTNLRWGHIGE